MAKKVYMLVATSVYLEYNCVERYLTVMNTLGTLLSFEELAGWYSIYDVRAIIYED